MGYSILLKEVCKTKRSLFHGRAMDRPFENCLTDRHILISLYLREKSNSNMSLPTKTHTNIFIFDERKVEF